jgi:hypothetical protein
MNKQPMAQSILSKQEKQELNRGGNRSISTQDMQDKIDAPRIVSAKELPRRKNAKYILSSGAGVNSTALLLFLVENKFPIDFVVFADTGDEMPETYAYIKKIKRYLKTKRIQFKEVRVRNNESLSERCLRRRVIPSQMWRWCTRDLKVIPIYAFYRSLKSHIYQYVGIDYDEVRRMKDSKADYVTNVYPLVDYKIGREECIRLIKKAGLPVPVKSGCYFCPFNTIERWAELYERHPDLYGKAMKIEETGKHMPKQKLFPMTLRILRHNLRKGVPLPMIQVESPCGNECMT